MARQVFRGKIAFRGENFGLMARNVNIDRASVTGLNESAHDRLVSPLTSEYATARRWQPFIYRGNWCTRDAEARVVDGLACTVC